MKGNAKMKLEYPPCLAFLFHDERFRNHIRHRCNCPKGEDCALKTLYQVITNNPIPPYLDIPMDPIRI